LFRGLIRSVILCFIRWSCSTFSPSTQTSR
jgi:hypothetical protein